MNNHLGAVIPREGKCSLVIFEVAGDKFFARQLLRPVDEKRLLQRFKPEDLKPGNVLKGGGRDIELVSRRDSGYWDIKIPSERIELSAKDIEELEAVENARQAEKVIVTRRGGSFTGRCIRFLPQRME